MPFPNKWLSGYLITVRQLKFASCYAWGAAWDCLLPICKIVNRGFLEKVLYNYTTGGIILDVIIQMCYLFSATKQKFYWVFT